MGANNATGLALEHNYNKQLDQDLIIPQTKRFTIYGEGGYDVTDNVSLYFEGLYNRRKTKTVAHRQLFFNQFTSSTILPAFFCSPVRDNNPNCCSSTGDPINTGFTGDVILEPVVVTNRGAKASTDINYCRAVGGAHGDLGGASAPGTGTPTCNIAVGRHITATTSSSSDRWIAQTLRTASCVGTTTAIRGVPCMDINYTDPRVLAGNFTPQELAFLFGSETGRTLYTQWTGEGSVTGDLFSLPAGKVKAALGVQWRRDEINDTPGAVTLDRQRSMARPVPASRPGAR